MAQETSADDALAVSHNSVRRVVQAILRRAQADGWTDEALEQASGVKARCIKSYRVEDREPSLSHALSLAVALGTPAINMVLGLIQHVAQAIGAAQETGPAFAAAEAMHHLARFARCAADNRIDHIEEPETTEATDNVIELLAPFSSKAARR
jgi:hypothetical protein